MGFDQVSDGYAVSDGRDEVSVVDDGGVAAAVRSTEEILETEVHGRRWVSLSLPLCVCV